MTRRSADLLTLAAAMGDDATDFHTSRYSTYQTTWKWS